MHAAQHEPNPIASLGACVGYYPCRGLTKAATLVDSSGNGRTLGEFAITAGTIAASYTRGAAAWNARGMRSSDAAFILNGAMSALCLIRGEPNNTGGNGAYLIVNETFALTRARYYLYLDSANNFALRYGHINASNAFAGFTASKCPVIPFQTPTVVGFDRAANGTDVTLYVNGEAVATDTLASAPTTGGSPEFSLSGLSGSGALFYNGVLEDASVYSSMIGAAAHRRAARYLLRRSR